MVWFYNMKFKLRSFQHNLRKFQHSQYGRKCLQSDSLAGFVNLWTQFETSVYVQRVVWFSNSVDEMSASFPTSSTPEAEIREPPNVPQTHGTADASQRELYLPAPCWSVGLLLHRCSLCHHRRSSGHKLHANVGWNLSDLG